MNPIRCKAWTPGALVYNTPASGKIVPMRERLTLSWFVEASDLKKERTGYIEGVVPIEQIVDRSRMNTMTIWGGPDLHMVQYLLEGGRVMNNVATICSRRAAPCSRK